MGFVEVPLDSRVRGNDKAGGCQVFALVPWIPDQVRDDKQEYKWSLMEESF